MKMQHFRTSALSTLGAVAVASLLPTLPLQADYPSTVLESVPVAYFPLDEGAGATTVSSLVSGLTGDVFGEPSRVPGPRGDGTTAFMFNNPFGTEQQYPPPSDWIRVPNNPVLDITGSVSLELWLNRASGDRVTWEGFAGKGDTAYQLRRNGGDTSSLGQNRIAWTVNYLLGRIPDDPPTATHGGAISSTEINFDQWMHLVGVVDFDARKQMLYIDGVLSVEVDLPDDPEWIWGYETVNVNDFDFMIGAHLSTLGDVQRGTAGAIAEVAVYDHALSAVRIQQHYEAMVGEPELWNGMVVTFDAEGLPWVNSPLYGSIMVEHSPWIWVHSMHSWFFLPEHDPDGSWGFIPSAGQ